MRPEHRIDRVSFRQGVLCKRMLLQPRHPAHPISWRPDLSGDVRPSTSRVAFASGPAVSPDSGSGVVAFDEGHLARARLSPQPACYGTVGRESRRYSLCGVVLQPFRDFRSLCVFDSPSVSFFIHGPSAANALITPPFLIVFYTTLAQVCYPVHSRRADNRKTGKTK